jgi:hypothetical protein
MSHGLPPLRCCRRRQRKAMALAPSQTERLARDRVSKTVADRLAKKDDYTRDITIACKSGWDKRVDARRTLHALVHTRSCLRSHKNAVETPQSCRLLSLPAEIVLMIARAVTEPVDLFRFCMTCKNVVRTVLETNSKQNTETELLKSAWCNKRDECTRFVQELDSALCLANYVRRHRVHRFGVRPELGACLSALEAAHTCGGSAAKLSLTSEKVQPFPEALIAASPSGQVFVVVDAARLCVVVDFFGDATAKCIAVSSCSMRDPPQINVLWSESAT